MDRTKTILIIALLALSAVLAFAPISLAGPGYPGLPTNWSNILTTISEIQSDINDLTFLETDYFFRNTMGTGSSAAYLQASTTYSTTVTDKVSATVTASDQVVASWSTQPNVPAITSFPGGTVEIHLYAKVTSTSGTKQASLYITGGAVNGAGTEASFGTSANSASLTTTITRYRFVVPVSATAMAVTDRLWAKAAAKLSGSGTDPVVEIYCSSTYPSHFVLPVSIGTTAQKNGDAAVPFSASTLTAATSVTTPIIDTPSGAPLVLRSSGTAYLTVDSNGAHVATLSQAVGASTAITLTAAGIVSFPNQSYVYANAAVANVSTYTNGVACIASFPNEVTDIQGEYNPSTSEFSPKVTGVYLFSVNAVCTPAVVPAAASRINIQVCESNTSGGVISGIESFLCNASISDGASTYIMGNGMVPVRCTVGKFYTVVITQQSGSDVGNSTTLSWTMRVARVN